MISNLKTESGVIVENFSFRQALAEKINHLKTRETISLRIQALLSLSSDRREAYAWLKERHCYVKYITKKKVIELRKM